MSETIKVPNNVPVSWLDRLEKLNADTLMLASDPDDRTETEYMSKYFTYFDLSDCMYNDLDIASIKYNLSNLMNGKADLSGFLSNWIRCDIDDPYVISALSQDWRGIITVQGYRLSSALANLYPSRTFSDEPGNYVSSITTKGGNVEEVKFGNSIDFIRKNSTISYFKDITDKDYLEGSKFSPSDMMDLSVIKLTYSQLKQLSSSNKIIPHCIYMTIQDEEG